MSKRSAKVYNKFTKECATCHKIFKSKYNHDAPNFCSTECYHRGHSLGLTRHKSIISITYECEYCHKEFVVHRKSKRKYCSQDCANAAQGLGRINYDSSGDKSQIEKARLNAICDICGFDRFIEIIHIIPSSAGGKFIWSNTLFACPNHHKLFDHHLLNENEIESLPLKAKIPYLDYKTYDSKIYQKYDNRKLPNPKKIPPIQDKVTGKFISRDDL